MSDIERRDAIKAIMAIGSGVMLGIPKLFAAEEKNTDQKILPVFSDTLTPKPLPFNPAKLKGISEKLIKSHWENNYAGTVKALNATKKQLNEVLNKKDFPPYLYADMKREHLLRTGSVVLHEIYFGNLGGDGKVGGEILNAIKASFGSFDTWETEFRKIGQGLSGGSGWVILGYNLQLQQLENYWSWDHMHNPPFTVPILIMDMYEHAYQMDYGAAAPMYIDAFFQNAHWQIADDRLSTARKMKWS